MVELLVVITIIAVLAALLFPALSRVRAGGDSTRCTSNLRQIGVAINAYANDHDDTFPGTLYYGQSPWYAKPYADGSLPALLQDYLGLKPLQEWDQRADAFVCPAYEKAVGVKDAPLYATLDLPSSKKFAANYGVSGNMRVWGYPQNPRYLPIRRAALAAGEDDKGVPFKTPQLVAVRDTDKQDYTSPRPGWYDKLPAKPVHGTHQNALYFDWHVGKVDPTTHLPLNAK